MKTTMYEMLAKIEAAPTHEQKIKLLRENAPQQFKDLLQGCFDARIIWLLPEGPVPFKPLEGDGVEKVFWAETRKLYLFVRGGNPNLKQLRRETLFIQLLESIDKKDANLLVSVKDKKLPFPSITYELLKEAWNIDYPKHISIEVGEQIANKIDLSKINTNWNDTPPIGCDPTPPDKLIEEGLRDIDPTLKKDKLSKRRIAAQRRRDEAKAKKQLKLEETKSVENTEA